MLLKLEILTRCKKKTPKQWLFLRKAGISWQPVGPGPCRYIFDFLFPATLEVHQLSVPQGLSLKSRKMLKREKHNWIPPFQSSALVIIAKKQCIMFSIYRRNKIVVLAIQFLWLSFWETKEMFLCMDKKLSFSLRYSASVNGFPFVKYHNLL